MKTTIKTQRKGFRFLRNLVILSMMAFLAASCGKENQSGKSSSSSNTNYGGFGNYGTVNGANINQVLDTISRENNCRSNGQYGNQQINTAGQRVRVQAQVQGVNPNAGSIYIGVSSYGDIAIIRNTNGQITTEIYACQRPGMTGQIQQASNVTIGHSSSCPVSEITAGYFNIPTQYGNFAFGVAPIHIPGTDRVSSLCNGNGQF
jgi:hypothetical protein